MPSFEETLAEPFEIVGEIVNDVNAFAGAIDADARVRRHGADKRQDVGEDLHLILGSGIQRINHDGHDVARRAWSVFGSVGEYARWKRFGAHADCAGRRALVVEERDVARFPAFGDDHVFPLQVHHRICIRVGDDDGEFDERRAGAERRRFGRRLGVPCGEQRGEYQQRHARHPASAHDRLRCRQRFT